MTDLAGIVTGAVIASVTGVGGAILGAWMSGRQQMAGLKLNIRADDDRMREAERRRIYAAYIAALTGMALAGLNIEDHREGATKEQLAELERELNVATAICVTAQAEVSLISGPALRDLAQETAVEMSDFSEAIAAGRDTDFDYYKVRRKLLDVMRDELDGEHASRPARVTAAREGRPAVATAETDSAGTARH